jgi:hypothetical protein
LSQLFEDFVGYVLAKRPLINLNGIDAAIIRIGHVADSRWLLCLTAHAEQFPLFGPSFLPCVFVRHPKFSLPIAIHDPWRFRAENQGDFPATWSMKPHTQYTGTGSIIVLKKAPKRTAEDECTPAVHYGNWGNPLFYGISK